MEENKEGKAMILSTMEKLPTQIPEIEIDMDSKPYFNNGIILPPKQIIFTELTEDNYQGFITARNYQIQQKEDEDTAKFLSSLTVAQFEENFPTNGKYEKESSINPMPLSSSILPRGKAPAKTYAKFPDHIDWPSYRMMKLTAGNSLFNKQLDYNFYSGSVAVSTCPACGFNRDVFPFWVKVNFIIDPKVCPNCKAGGSGVNLKKKCARTAAKLTEKYSIKDEETVDTLIWKSPHHTYSIVCSSIWYTI